MRLDKCFVCGKKLTGWQEKFCSRICKDLERNSRRKPKESICEGCGKSFMRGFDGVRPYGRCLCRACVNREHVGLSGPLSPQWKGGSRGWQAGKLGRDKAGLSWRVQRKLAWERDNYICQDADGTCSPLRNGKPDCHHKVPYRLSFSHALDNLICLCPHHHKVREAQIKELWGGQSFGGNKRPRIWRVDPCGCCGKRGLKLVDDLCRQCRKDKELIPRAKQLRSLGLSYVKIGKELGCGRQTVWDWIHGKHVRG